MIRAPAVASLLLLALLGCGDSSAPDPPGLQPAEGDEAAAPDSAEVETDDETFDQLAALGYVGFVDPEEGAEASGVVLRDAAAMAPGYRFFTNRDFCSAVLMDEAGSLVNVWEMRDCHHWSIAKLQPDGDVFVLGVGVGEHEPPSALDGLRFLARLDWHGEVLWRKALPAHHDLTVGEGGEIATLLNVRRELPEVHPSLATRDNRVVRLGPEGEERESLSLYDLFTASPDVVTVRSRAANEEDVDLFHMNSIQWMREIPGTAEGPLYAPTNLLLTSRHQNVVLILDWEARKILWAWGQQKKGLRGPHDATLLPNGNILIFDNGLTREWSRVLEVDPRTDAVVFEYRETPRKAFYSATRGSAQRLPNGNLLVAESDKGIAFEVAPDGRRVWEFRSPFQNEAGQRATMVRIRRYEREAIDAIIAKRGTPEPATPRGYRASAKR